MTQDDKQFDVALSFAGENREYVERVAATLRRMDIRVFYDKYERVTLWGKNLYEHLEDVYRNKARFTIIFCSKHYAEKLWTNHERKAAQAKAFESSQEYILPARFDDTEIPGILPTIGYVDLTKCSPEEFAELVKEKVGPIRRVEFFPEEPDLLYEKIGADTPELQEEAWLLAHHFFEALKLMTIEERMLLVTVITNTCPAGPPENVHLNIEYLARLVGLSVEEIISKFARLDCLGIVASLERHDENPDHICEAKNVIRIEYRPLVPDCRDNATYVAIAIIAIVFDNLCPDCRVRAINHLDFSILSSLTGYPERYDG
jgi:hypothetical protein